MVARKYSDFWITMLPSIRRCLYECTDVEYLDLKRSTFESLGNRKRYAFNIQYSKGEVTNNLGGSAVARDLDRVLRNDSKAYDVLQCGGFKINMDKDFVLWITKMR